MTVKLHCLYCTHAKVNYSQTDTHIHLPPLLSLEKTTRVPFTLQMTQVSPFQHSDVFGCWLPVAICVMMEVT